MSSKLLAVILLTAPALCAQSPELPASSIKDKVAKACTACHDASIIVQQRLSNATWTKEVDKMTKWGASVDPADRDAIIDYLSVNFSPDKAPAEMPHTAASQ